MKTIKNKISLFSLSALFLSLFLGSCSDEYEAPDTLSDASWYTTQTMKNGNLNRYVVAAGKSITFMDVSQGAVTHEWQIKSPDVFLNDVVDLKDTLENQINTKLGETNKAKVATVLFRSAGMDSVILHNIFEDSVTFHGKNGDIASVKENGEWVLNKVFYVDVFGELAPAFDVLDADSTLLYSFSAEQLKNTTDVADYDSINIEAGKSLIFVDKSEAGRPNNRTWNTPSGTPVSGNKEKYAVSFYLPGSYSNLKMTSLRNGNDSVPAGKVVVNIPLKINVIASTSAYTIIDKNTSDTDNNKVTQIADNQLRFTTGGVVDGSSLASCAGDFILHVKNTNVIPNVDKDIAISSVQALPTDLKSVVLTIDEAIYENDEVSLSYNGVSFKAADGRSLSKFNNEGITLLKGENVMLDLDGNSYGSFETEQNNNVAWCWWTPNTSKVNFVRSDEQAAAGDYSCLISGQAGITTGNPTVLTTKVDGNFYFNYPASTYSLSMKVYVDPNVANTGAKIHTLCKVNGQSLTWDLSSIKKGEWVTLPAKQMVFTKDEEQFKIQLQSADIVDKYRFFVDDIQLVSSHLRPGTSITPIDPVTPVDPDPVTPVVKGENVLLDADGDSYGTFDKKQTNNLAWGWYTTKKDIYTRSTDQHVSGEASLCVQSDGAFSGKAVVMTPKIDGDFLFQPAAGTYSLKMKVYVDDSVDNTKVTFGTVCLKNGQEKLWDATSIARNTWVELPAQDVIISDPETQFKITLTSGNIEGPVKFYIDDVELLLK